MHLLHSLMRHRAGAGEIERKPIAWSAEELWQVIGHLNTHFQAKLPQSVSLIYKYHTDEALYNISCL